MERNTRALCAEGKRDATFGWREMELIGNYLRVETGFTESSVDCAAIHKIVGDAEYTFIYTGSAEALIISRNQTSDGYHQFVAELREAWENRDALPPVPEPESPRGMHRRPAEMKAAQFRLGCGNVGGASLSQRSAGGVSKMTSPLAGSTIHEPWFISSSSCSGAQPE